MKIVYDKKKAIETIEQINAEMPERIQKIKCKNRYLAVGCVLGAIALTIAWDFAALWIAQYLTAENSSEALYRMNYAIPFIIGLSFIIGFFWKIFLSYGEEILTPEDYYTDAAAYHQLLQNYKVITADGPWCSTEPPSDKFHINFTVEDSDHIVHTKRIHLFHVKVQYKTDIDETVIELDTCTIYKPYNNPNHTEEDD